MTYMAGQFNLPIWGYNMVLILIVRRIKNRGTWVAQSVKRPTLDFDSGHDLRVLETEPHGRSAGSLLGKEANLIDQPFVAYLPDPKL